MPLAPGSRLGPYVIESALGAGGMGEVYKARDTRLDRTVAIKILPADVSRDPERRARFEREAKTIAGLNHSHICTLHDIGDHEGAIFLVMEHLAGETLAARLQKGPLPLDQALRLGAEIAEALAAAHRQGVVHRDLKPGNVVITKAGAKLLDFGLAKLKAASANRAISSSALATGEPLTGQGLVLGTIPYMSPEQLEGKELDARSDIFSFGALLYEMLTGKRAFEGTSQASVISAIVSSEPAAVSTVQPVTPPAVDRIVARCLAKDPDARWDSAHDIADELRWISQPPERAAAALGRSPANRRRRILAASGIVLLTVIAAAALALWARSRHAAESFVPAAITRIAVLPLENLSGDAGQEYFADGLTDSLINELAQVKALRVISRTSVMRFKGTRKPLKEIAGELNGVGAILEGSVMRDAGRVAVTVRLVDTASDANVWSQNYERQLTDILTLRREIARSVAQGIRGALKPEDEHRLGRRDTVNPEAFDYYLRAVEAFTKGNTPQTFRASLDAARKAVALDSRFAEGYVALTEASAGLWWYYFDHSPERAAEARSAAAKALELDPQSPAAHWAQGAVYYHLELDYENALKEFSIALSANPSDVKSLAYTGYVKRRQGKDEETVAYLKKALAVDPLAADLSFNLGETYALLRRDEDAEQCYATAIKQSPAYNRPHAYRLRSRLRLRPDIAGAHEAERQASAAGLAADPLVLYHRILVRMFEGDLQGALALLAASPVEAFEESFWFVPRALLEAQVHERLGERAKVRARYEEARRVIESKLRTDASDSRYRSALGLTLAGLGEKAAAVREGRAGVDAMPLSLDAYRGMYRLEDLARIYAATGERDLAVEVLGRLLATPADLTAAALSRDPAWATLRGHPRFERLTAQPRGSR